MTEKSWLQKKFRNVCWTLFNFTDADKELMLNGDIFAYSCFGEETCPTTGKAHLQGYSELKEQVRGASLKKFHAEVHWEARITDNGSQARAYCKGPWEGIDYKTKEPKSKPENPTFKENGTMKHAGKRTDLDGLVSEVLDGTKEIDDIVIEKPLMFHQYGRTLERAESIRRNRLQRNFMTKGYWFWGPAGTGKTRAVHEKETDLCTHVESKTGWFDNYKQQKALLIDDYRGKHIQYEELLRLVDRYPTYVEIKHKQPMSFVSEVVYITCPLHPRDIFTNRASGDGLDQLYRRFEIVEFKKEEPVSKETVSEVLKGNTETHLIDAYVDKQKIKKTVLSAKNILKKLRLTSRSSKQQS